MDTLKEMIEMLIAKGAEKITINKFVSKDGFVIEGIDIKMDKKDIYVGNGLFLKKGSKI